MNLENNLNFKSKYYYYLWYLSYIVSLWDDEEAGCDEKRTHGNILLGNVTYPIKPLVETAQGKCERDLYIMADLTTLRFKHFIEIGNFSSC